MTKEEINAALIELAQLVDRLIPDTSVHFFVAAASADEGFGQVHVIGCCERSTPLIAKAIVERKLEHTENVTHKVRPN